MKKILDIARVVRSKNSGPYELVLDIMLKNRELFDRLRQSGQFSAEKVAAAYGVELAEIRNIVWFEPANAVKVVMPAASSPAHRAIPTFMGRSNTRRCSGWSLTCRAGRGKGEERRVRHPVFTDCAFLKRRFPPSRIRHDRFYPSPLYDRF